MVLGRIDQIAQATQQRNFHIDRSFILAGGLEGKSSGSGRVKTTILAGDQLSTAKFVDIPDLLVNL